MLQSGDEGLSLGAEDPHTEMHKLDMIETQKKSCNHQASYRA